MTPPLNCCGWTFKGDLCTLRYDTGSGCGATYFRPASENGPEAAGVLSSVPSTESPTSAPLFYVPLDAARQSTRWRHIKLQVKENGNMTLSVDGAHNMMVLLADGVTKAEQPLRAYGFRVSSPSACSSVINTTAAV
eukprot:gene22129-16467_t